MTKREHILGKIGQYSDAAWRCRERAWLARRAEDHELVRRCERAERVADRHWELWLARLDDEDERRAS